MYFGTVDFGTPGEEQRYLPAKIVDSEANYLRLFGGAKTSQLIGETTAAYLANKYPAQRVRNAIPEANIIIVSREPVDRAYSFCFLWASLGHGKHTPFCDAFIEDHRHLMNFAALDSLCIWPVHYYQIERDLSGGLA